MLELIKAIKFENRRMTTGAEVALIRQALNISGKTNRELQALRDSVVREIDTDESPEAWDAVMRATSVIDQEKWQRGMEV